jgi:hypothetical protein
VCAMQMLLAGDHPTLKTLREQFRSAVITERTLTGVGFYVTFRVQKEVACVNNKELQYLCDVNAEIEDVPHGARFVLHIVDGVIDYLEGVTVDGPWPATVKRFHLNYVSGSERDLTVLGEK